METLNGAETVKGMGIERKMRIQWEKSMPRHLMCNTVRSVLEYGSVDKPTVKCHNNHYYFMDEFNLVLASELTVGQLIAFNALMGSVLAPLMGLVGMWNQVHGQALLWNTWVIFWISSLNKNLGTLTRIVLPNLRRHGV
ncbi:MAG: hypothetical protein R3E93_08140 [Thiothrix sp.]